MPVRRELQTQGMVLCGEDDGDIDLALLEKVDSVLRRRIYLRNIRRVYRRNEKQERLELMDKVVGLEAQLKKLQTPSSKSQTQDTPKSLLSWAIVAETLADEKNAVVAENSSLKHDIAKYKSFGEGMQKWVAAQHTAVRSKRGKNLPRQINMDLMHLWAQLSAENVPRRIRALPSWHNTTLFAEPSLRKMGKQWITQQMFHNTERMYQTFSFPPFESDTPCFYINFEYDDVKYDAVLCRQYGDSRDFDVVCDLYRYRLCDELAVEGPARTLINTIKEQDDLTTLHQMTTRDGEWINLVCSEYREDGRSFFVVQQIIDDELLVHDNSRLRNRMSWIDVRRMPDGSTKKRLICFQSQSFTKADGAVPLEEEVAMWGLYLAAEMKNEAKAMTFKRYLENQLQHAL
ncbi:unnamed protein product [Aphanomyces euteiches]|uniref:Uncharacterized protein n=1 Tax=Aphanomyces euteiches TaxID=100861 RepID=A0A6G0XG16_9STRA|nr:hypothetical protein Ae201684_005147 [Aphanomyces euteiches]